MLAVLASGIVAGTSVGVSAAGAAEHASKAAFCGANDSIDRAGANVNSNAGFLAVLKKHTHDLTILKENAPPGALGQTVKETVTEAEAAISSNNANELNNIPNGAAIDTYCGVNGNGAPLPSYFGKGKTTTFCSTFVPIYQAARTPPTRRCPRRYHGPPRRRSTNSLRSCRRCPSRSRPRPRPRWTRLKRP